MLKQEAVLVIGCTGAVGLAICRTAAREGADTAFTCYMTRDCTSHRR